LGNKLQPRPRPNYPMPRTKGSFVNMNLRDDDIVFFVLYVPIYAIKLYLPCVENLRERKITVSTF
jgi:hypothetical protein